MIDYTKQANVFVSICSCQQTHFQLERLYVDPTAKQYRLPLQNTQLILFLDVHVGVKLCLQTTTVLNHDNEVVVWFPRSILENIRRRNKGRATYLQMKLFFCDGKSALLHSRRACQSRWRCSTVVQQKSKSKMGGNASIPFFLAKMADHVKVTDIVSYMHSGISIDQPYRTSKPCPRSTFLVTAAPAVFCHVTWLRWSMATMPSRVQSGKIGLGLFAWQGKAKSFLMWVIEVSSQIQVSFGSYLSFKSLDK